MDIPNLAAVFCPGILRHPDHNTPIQYKISQYVIEFLVEFQSLFTLQLLVTSKRKKSSSSEVPPVPLLLPSSTAKYQQAAATAPPPVPLHVVSPSALAINSSSLSSLAPNTSSSFIESPVDIPGTTTNDKDINSSSSDQSTTKATAAATITTTKESLTHMLHKFAKITAPYYRMMSENFTELRHTIEPWIGKKVKLRWYYVLSY